MPKPPTKQTYDGLDAAYAYFNKKLLAATATAGAAARGLGTGRHRWHRSYRSPTVHLPLLHLSRARILHTKKRGGDV
jgi:hypothetical protein